MRRAIRALGIAVLGPTAGAGQDIEITAALTDRTLPDAYYARVRENPSFFDVQAGWIHTTRTAIAAGRDVAGALPVAIVHALFADSPEPFLSVDAVQASLFDGPSPYGGTVTGFYEENSGGRFTITGRAFPWVRTSVTREEVVGSSFGLGGGTMLPAYMTEALALTDVAADFRRYDNDGPDGIPNSGDDDGRVDAVAFQFLEVAASCGGNGVWPHRSRIAGWTGSPYRTNDTGANGLPILIDDYIIQSATTCAGDAVQNPSTIAHELGHVLGLPDLYDSSEGILPEQRRWVVGCWSLMAAGAWGCENVDRTEVELPTHLGAWEKIRLGWASEELVADRFLDRAFHLDPVVGSERVLRIPLSDTEYYLIEYRRRLGFDIGLPSTGVLIYHIDPSKPIRPCSGCPKEYRVALVEADANAGLVTPGLEGGNRGEPGDAFAWNGPVRFTGSTSPATTLNSGEPSSIAFSDIRLDGGVARLVLSTTTYALSALLGPFFPSVGGALLEEDIEVLDEAGNGNGRYDVGDLRRYVLDNPAVASR